MDDKRDVDEIEITPEMIEAGVDVWRRWNELFDSPDTGVARIYRAMICARPESGNPVATCQGASRDSSEKSGCRSLSKES